MNKRDEFLRLADEVGEDEANDPWTKEPWPKWFEKVALRLARNFIPALKVTDFRNKRERFVGYGLAFVSGIIEESQKVDTSKFSEEPVYAALKEELETIETIEAPKIAKAISAAQLLPSDLSGEFFTAYADGLKRHIAKFAMARLADNHTAQICLFLILARPWIEGEGVKRAESITVLFKNFMKIREAVPGQKEFFERCPEARRSLEAQFRNICSEDGVRVRGRGRPRKIQPPSG